MNTVLGKIMRTLLDFITEGVNDKGIFKAVFMAGGPGSGKDTVMHQVLGGHGLREINSDVAFEHLMGKHGLSKKMPESETEKRDLVRARAKQITHAREKLALAGRNGVVINGTGGDHEKIAKMKDALEKHGYETHMLYVHADNPVSRSRNIARGQRGGRSVRENIRQEKWNEVNAAKPHLKKLFGDNFKEFDNSADTSHGSPVEVRRAQNDKLTALHKHFGKVVAKAPESPTAKGWIAAEKDKLKR